MFFCSRCGAQIPTDARFCPKCGMLQEIAETPYAGQPRRLVRPREGRMIAGVCQGVAQYMNWDVSLVRILLVVLVLGAGTGVLAYIIGWIVMPEADYSLPPGTMPPPPPPPAA